MAVAAPADKRFRRSHIRPSRRRSLSLTRLLTAARMLTAAGVLGGAGWYAAQVVTDSPALRVSQIHVRGNQHLARGDVLALLAGLEGEHLLQTDLEQWRRMVLGSPWVEQAVLRRVLPSTVEVVIRERTPMAIGRIRGDLYLVDEQGLVIDEFGPNYAQFDLPIVDGLADPAGDGEPNVDPARAGLAAGLLRALEGQPALMKRVSQIDVASAHDAVRAARSGSRAGARRRRAVRRTASAVPGTARGAPLRACPISSTWTFGSTTGSTCGQASLQRCNG